MKRSVIEKIARFGRDPFALLIVFLAGLGTAHILVRTATYGAAVEYDSIFLLSTVINFLAGEGWQHFLGRPLVRWLPLFPLLVALLGWVGIEPLEAGRWINATAFGLTILVAGYWLRSNLRSRGLALAATAVSAASLPLNELASHFLTDSLFTLFTLLALIQLAAFLQRGERTPLLLSAVFTALAALTRYPAVVLIGVGVLVLLVRRAPPLAVRLKHAVVFGAISSIPLAGVLTRNWVVTGTLTGRRFPLGASLSDVLSRVADVFQAWMIPPNAPDGIGYLLWMAAGLVVLAAGVVVVLASRSFCMGGKSPSFGLGLAIPFGVFTLAYLLFMVAIVPLVIHRELPARYLLPVYVPLLLMAVFLLDRFLSIKAAGYVAAAKWGLASLVLLGSLAHIGYSTHRNLRITHQAWRDGYLRWTVNGSYWASSESLNYIKTNSNYGRMYSNTPSLAWFWDRTADPEKYHYLPIDLHHLTSAIMQSDDPPYILWLRSEKSLSDYGELDLRCLPGVEPVAELADGVVFRCTAAEPFDAKRHRACKQRYVQGLLEQAGKRVVRAGWDVYRNGRTLTYHKQPCAPADVKTNFLLEVIPDDPADLPAHRQQFYDSENLGFNFHIRGGVRLDDQCVATIQLPDYPVSRIRVGLWIANAKDPRVLGGEFSVAEDGSYGESSAILKYIRDHRMDGPVYSNAPHLAWFYDRTAALGKHQSLPDDLHLMMSTINAGSDDDTPYIVWLRNEKSLYDYNEFDIRCLPGVEPVAELADGVVFRVTASEPFDAERHGARKQRYVQGLLEQAGERVVRADSMWPLGTWGVGVEQADEQMVRAGWDVYRTGRTLTYHKQPCAPDDVQTNFLLQLSPVDPANLPADRKQHGSENLDFNFHRRGGIRLDDQCVVTAQLPDYPIDRLYIGRWISSNNRILWTHNMELKADARVDALNP